MVTERVRLPGDGELPYPSGYILNGDGTLPAYPFRVACEGDVADPNLERRGGDALVAALVSAAAAFTITRATRRVSTTTRGSTRTRTRTETVGLAILHGDAHAHLEGRRRGHVLAAAVERDGGGGGMRGAMGGATETAVGGHDVRRGKDCERRQTSRGVTETSTRGRVWA